jgi:phosphohistidine phosphatase SixA
MFVKCCKSEEFTMKTAKVWIGLGLGACVLAGQSMSLQAETKIKTSNFTQIAAAGDAGESGESGEVPAGVQILASENMTPALAKELVTSLRSGGYVIYFRHFETGKDTPDFTNATMGDCGSQRQLNEDGAKEAVRVRNAFQKLELPVSKVLSSPFCRAWQSADLAFGGHEVVEGLKLPAAKEFGPVEKKAMRDTLFPLLAATPKEHTNTVIVAHDDNLPTVGAPYPESQGEALIFKPSGHGNFSLKFQVKPDVWDALLNS